MYKPRLPAKGYESWMPSNLLHSHTLHKGEMVPSKTHTVLVNGDIMSTITLLPDSCIVFCYENHAVHKQDHMVEPVLLPSYAKFEYSIDEECKVERKMRPTKLVYHFFDGRHTVAIFNNSLVIQHDAQKDRKLRVSHLEMYPFGGIYLEKEAPSWDSVTGNKVIEFVCIGFEKATGMLRQKELRLILSAAD